MDNPLEPVWHNQLGGLTFRASGPGGTRFIKYGTRNAETHDAGRTATTRMGVPLGFGSTSSGCRRERHHEWLVTSAPLLVSSPRSAL